MLVPPQSGQTQTLTKLKVSLTNNNQHMDKLGLILLVFSFVCFCLSVWNAASPNWNKLVSAGLAFLAAALVFGNAGMIFK